MNLYETDVLFHSVACSEHCLWKRSPPTSFSFLLLPLTIAQYFCQTTRRNCLCCLAVASQKLKSKTVYGEAVYGFGYFMQISSITFQSIRQTVAEGSLDRFGGWERANLFPSFHWQLVNFRSQHFQFIFAFPHTPSPIELFTLLPPVTICNTHRGWRTTGLVQFWLWLPPPPVDWLSVGRSACPSVRPSVTHSIETRRGEWPVTSSSCACPKDFQSNLSNITTFNQTQKALQLIFLSSTLSDDDDEDDETTLQDTHVTTNELTMDTATE